MILLLVMVAAFGVGLLRGGHVEALSAVRLRGSAAIIVLFLVQFALRQFAPGLRVLSGTAVVWLWCVISVSLVAVCAVNWRTAGMPLIALGMALNLMVVILNTGMPVGGPLAEAFDMDPSAQSIAAHGGFYRMVDSGTILVALGDVIPLRVPRPARSLVSIGDLLMFVGAGLLVEQGVAAGRYRGKHSRRAGGSAV